MNKLILPIVVFSLLTIVIACKKEVTSLTNKEPEIPVTVLNKYATFLVPVVAGSKASGNFSVDFGIPENSGHTIKEISRVLYSTSSAASGLLLAATVKKDTTQGIYTSVAIPGNGTKATFTSSFSDFKSITQLKRPGGGIPEPTDNSALIPMYFHFLLKLDDGTQIVTTPVRVIVVP